MKKIIVLFFFVFVSCQKEEFSIYGTWYGVYEKDNHTDYYVNKYLELQFDTFGYVTLTPYNNELVDYWQSGAGTYQLESDNIVFNLTVDVPPAYSWLPTVQKEIINGKVGYSPGFERYYIDIKIKTIRSDREPSYKTITFYRKRPLHIVFKE